MPKKIVILTAAFGEGHNSAARGVRDGLRQIAPDCAVEVRDLFQEIYGPLNRFTCRMYLAVINHAPQTWAKLYRWLDRRKKFRGGLRLFLPARLRLARIARRDRPDVFVSVYPPYTHFLEDSFGPVNGSGPKRVVVITDSITVNAVWFRCSADAFLLANDETADVLTRAEVPSALLRVTGFPVDPRFADSSLTQLRPAVPPWRILYMINANKATAPDLVRRVLEVPDVKLTVTVGRDEILRARLKEVQRETGIDFEIVGWCTELPHLLNRHHLLIGKAGGATVQEAIAAACPMIINQVVPGQEEGNAMLIKQTQSGAVALSPESVIATLHAALASRGALLQEWSANIAKISRPDASLRIAEYLLSL